MENNQPDQFQQPPVEEQQPQVQIPSQGSSKKPVIVFAIVIIFIAIVTGSLFIFFGSSGTTNSKILPTPAVSNPVITPLPTVSSETSIKLTLTKGKIVSIPTTDITIEYVGASLPNPKCFDCIATTDLAVIKSDIRKILSYSCGGISGQCTDSYKEFDIEVTLENATENTAQVTIKK